MFIFFDLAIYDIGVANLLLIFSKIIFSQPHQYRIFIGIRIGLGILCAISFMNALYTTLDIYLATDIPTFGILMYAVTLPVLFSIKILMILMFVTFSIILIKSIYKSRDNVSTETKILIAKIIIVIILSVISNACIGIGAILAYLQGVIPLVALYMLPGGILYGATIIAFWPNRNKFKEAFCISTIIKKQPVTEIPIPSISTNDQHNSPTPV
jgi:hypothetical protein